MNKTKIISILLLVALLGAIIPSLPLQFAHATTPVQWVVNPSFESATGGWTGGFPADRTTQHAHTGSYSVNIYTNTITQAFSPTDTNRVASFTYWVYRNTEGGSGNFFHTVVHYSDTSTSTLTISTANTTANTWIQITQIVTPAKFITSIVFIGGTFDVCWIDDVYLIVNVPQVVITATTHTGGGTITPSGSVSVAYGDNQTFTITPDPNSHIAGIYVDNVSAGIGTGYTFYSVIANHTITVNFDSGKITNPDDGTNVYAEKQAYDLQAIVGLVPGSTIKAVHVALKNGVVSVYMNGTALNTVPVWTISSAKWDLGTGTWDAATSTAVFPITPHWDANTGTYTIYVSALDTWGHNSTWITESTFVVVNRLVLDQYGSNVTTVVTGNHLRVSGTIRYALTPTGNNPSTSYPPNTEVITAQIRDQFNVSYGSSLLTSGAFLTVFPVTGFSQTNKLYVWLFSPSSGFKAGLTPEGKFLTVAMISSNSTNIISNAFSMFGMANYLTNIISALTAFGAWFAQSLSYFVSLLIQVVTFLMYTGGVAIWWVTSFFTMITTIIGFINSLLHGTIGLVGTTIDWFAIFFTAQNLYFALIIMFILWFDALALRAHNQGVTWLQVLVADTQTAIYIVGFMINTALSLVNFVLDVIMRFISIF